MAILDDDSAEINMYGDVLMKTPRDWQTKETLPGSYISAEEFLNDIEDIKDKNNITIHINSGGGDLYAGLAIYNRLKRLNGHVTTINDGIAASAASLIFQAGNTRKMNAGSNLMAHGASGFLFGYYNTEDLKQTLDEFKAHDRAIVNVYAEAMGVSASEAKKFVSGETWLTGQDAIDKGLADELVEEEEEEEENSFMNRMFTNLSQRCYTKNLTIPAAVPPIVNKTEEIGGTEEMEIKNLEDLRQAYPEYVAQIENAASKKGSEDAINAEKERIKAIEEIESTIVDKELIQEAKYGENPMTAEQLAFKAMKKQAETNASMLESIKNDSQASQAGRVKAESSEDEKEEEKKKEEEEAKNAAEMYNMMKKGGTR